MHACLLDTDVAGTMQDLTTKAGLAREADIDPRNPILDDLQPVGQVKLRGNNAVKVYEREKAVAELAKRLVEAAARNSKS